MANKRAKESIYHPNPFLFKRRIPETKGDNVKKIKNRISKFIPEAASGPNNTINSADNPHKNTKKPTIVTSQATILVNIGNWGSWVFGLGSSILKTI